MESRWSRRRWALIAVVTGTATTTAGSTLVACGGSPSRVAGAHEAQPDTVEVSTAASADASASSGRYRPIGTASASIRPLPGPVHEILATSPPGFTRCMPRPAPENVCLAIGDPLLSKRFGTSVASRLLDGPVEVQSSPQAEVRCCYREQMTKTLGRPLLTIEGAIHASLCVTAAWI